MNREKETMDGNTAAAYVAYAFSEVAAIYPITPSSTMAETIDHFAVEGKENIFGHQLKIVQLQSEAGVAGTLHGSLAAGALTSTFTSSQGLLLMIPNMYKIAAEQLPGVFYVAARTIATHALSIFGEHSDVYACRQTGCAMLCENNPQEIMDLAPVAHLSAIEGRLPFINFFDGFRTSHEIQKVKKWDYESLYKMCNHDALAEYRKLALNPANPSIRGSHENDDTYFQNREAINSVYNNIPHVVKKYLGVINKSLDTDYDLFNYYGSSEAERVIVAMGSVCDTCEEVINYLMSQGQKVGLVKVRLYRPWDSRTFLSKIPESVKKIAVLDRTKEPGAVGEPLFLDVIASFYEGNRRDIYISGGRYGLSSKNTGPEEILSVYDELTKRKPRRRFTVGIHDDVTYLSLPVSKTIFKDIRSNMMECKFYGLGGDGTVGANKDSIKIIGDNTNLYVQAYFQYDSKKSNGVTVSHLRFGEFPIHKPYYVKNADFISISNPYFILKGFKIFQRVKENGNILINWPSSDDDFVEQLSHDDKAYIVNNKLNIYLINANEIAQKIGLKNKTSSILQASFFAITKIIPVEDAVKYMDEKINERFSSKGEKIVSMNIEAIKNGIVEYRKLDTSMIEQSKVDAGKNTRQVFTSMVNADKMELVGPITRMEGDEIPVSAFLSHSDGRFDVGASKLERRGVAVMVPTWNHEKCVQCAKCSFVCSHTAIRAFLVNDEELKKAPSGLKYAETKPRTSENKYVIAVSPLNCTGCGECVTVCPDVANAIHMVPREQEKEEQNIFDYLVENTSYKHVGIPLNTVKGSQLKQPLLEFSGACGGCAEPSYARLITQLFGEEMIIANATGCSSIWGGTAALSPYTVNHETGQGPAWSNSLFEDNAEYGLGLYLGHEAIRNRIIDKLIELNANDYVSYRFKHYLHNYLNTKDSTLENSNATKEIIRELEVMYKELSIVNEFDAENLYINDSNSDVCDSFNVGIDTNGNLDSKLTYAKREIKYLLDNKQYLSKKSIWLFGGDGWAYDIGYGGLDHVLASGENINVFVFDTEVYSNTGGQSSKATNTGAVCQFSSNGKEMSKKPLAEMAMAYGYVYVAQVAMGANMEHTLKVILEAENYNGPSLIIGYSPCELHGLKGGMGQCQMEMKRAVAAGYWNLFSYNPDLKNKGKNPFVIVSAEGDGSYEEFIKNESRFSALNVTNPERAEELKDKAYKEINERYKHLEKLRKLYEE